MKNIITFINLLTITFSITAISAQTTAPDEDTGPITACRDGFSNVSRDSSEFPGGAVNDGKIDDRSCYSDYDQVRLYNKDWGIYNITAGSNHLGTSLQPRIERSLPRSQEVGVGSYARFSGTVRILEVGDAAGTGSDGTYMMQSKGKHTGGGGSPDPAICLYLVKPVIAKDAQGREYQKSFKLYREQIKFRGGSGADGRDVVFLTDMKKNEQIEVILEVGFRQDPNDPTKRIHYSDATIGGKLFAWNIPQPERGVESGIRYGAYRVHGGRAQIRWADTKYVKKEIKFDPNATTNRAPEVTVTSPVNNAEFSLGDTITLAADASDPDGNLDKVNFKINDEFLVTDNARPFETTFTPAAVGTYKIAARAFDKTGIFKEEFISIKVVDNNAAPVVNITSPANGAEFTVGEQIPFTVSASDPDGNLDKVNFFANNDIFKSDNARPYDATFTPTAPGSYEIIARAIDTDNAKTDATITITVVAQPFQITEYFKIRNVATGEYLTNAPNTSEPVTTQSTAEGGNKNWGIAPSGNFSNIVNQESGVLRATGANFTQGAFLVVGANKQATTADSDKIWNLIYDASSDTYRIEAGDSNRFLYHNANGTVTTVDAPNSDTRSIWELVSLDDTSLSIFDVEKVVNNVKLYPNPVVDNFTLDFDQIDNGKEKQIEIYSLSGQLAYKSSTDTNLVEINLPSLSSGLYLVKVRFAGNRIFCSKLMVE